MNTLSVLDGAGLSSVEFVQNYVQLRFDEGCLTAIMEPRVWLEDRCFVWGDSEYRNVLCGQIGKLLLRASTIGEEEIRLEFEDGSRISIPLESPIQPMDEAAIFDHPFQPMCVWSARKSGI